MKFYYIQDIKCSLLQLMIYMLDLVVYYIQDDMIILFCTDNVYDDDLDWGIFIKYVLQL